MSNKNMKKFLPSFSAGIIVVALIIGLKYDYTYARQSTSSDNDAYYTWSDIFGQVMKRAHQDYVTPIDDSAVISAAIDAALEELDPHTVFFQPKEYNELMVQTEGEFGGLGIQIALRDKILTVMTPIAGTPASRAGIRSGDKILEIEGKSTQGISLEEAVENLRGKPKTKVSITIGREGSVEPLEFEIERAIIDIKSVPYAGFIEDSIGYIRLTTFSQKAADDVAHFTDSLLALGMNGLVFDLRSNPGGLLLQAQAVSELFLDKGQLIVYTEGRSIRDNKKFNARHKSLLPSKIPLVVLVNGASASASEIVAGAVQDWDRGVVMGDTTFGKGSVQSIAPVDISTNSHMKMTTAYYYTPSGRCINRSHKKKKDSEAKGTWNISDSSKDSSSDANNDSVATGDTTKYFTASGRVVYGGGGIIPDTIVELTPPVFMVQQLLNKDLFFTFVNSYFPTLEKKGISVDENYKVDKTILDAFYTYIDSSDVEIVTAAEKRFNEFKVYAGFEEDTSIDSSTLDYLKNDWDSKDTAEVLQLISSLEKKLVTSRKQMVEVHTTEIERYLNETIIAHVLGQDYPALYKQRLARDEQVQAAISFLLNKEAYKEELKKKK